MLASSSNFGSQASRRHARVLGALWWGSKICKVRSGEKAHAIQDLCFRSGQRSCQVPINVFGELARSRHVGVPSDFEKVWMECSEEKKDAGSGEVYIYPDARQVDMETLSDVFGRHASGSLPLLQTVSHTFQSHASLFGQGQSPWTDLRVEELHIIGSECHFLPNRTSAL